MLIMGTKQPLLPDNIVQGYGTLYEPMENEDIEKPPNDQRVEHYLQIY